jgi:osmotically-inducible protein OsmY
MRYTRIIIIVVLNGLLSGCLGLSGAWTGATWFYDRHDFYKKMTDYQLVAEANRALYHDAKFKHYGCSIDVAALNGDLLMVGHVPNDMLREEAYQRVARKGGYRRFFKQITVGYFADNTAEDAWITAKIRSQMTADSNIDPHQFKVITFDRVVYLMGDAFPEDAKRVLDIARQTSEVVRVVKLFKYFHYISTGDV